MKENNIHIRHAKSKADIASAKALIVDFIHELPVSVDFQDVHGELDEFPARFESVLVAETEAGEIVGVVALKDLSSYAVGTSELKRMYISPSVRGLGVGKQMVERLVEDARTRGYSCMMLDTLWRLAPAVRLYEQCGFKHRAAYYDNPYEDAVFMERMI